MAEVIAWIFTTQEGFVTLVGLASLVGVYIPLPGPVEEPVF
jgi:hypothetical protein